MERILRSVIQVGGSPEFDDANNNWQKLQDYTLEYESEEDGKIFKYLKDFYNQMSAPPDFGLVKEYFEKEEDIDTVSRLDEIKAAQFYIRTNFISIVRSIQDRQLIKNFVLLMRDASAVAEHGRNVDKPLDGKKVLKGVSDAVGMLVEKLPNFTRIEAGERLEGIVHEDENEVIDEYELIANTDKYAGRNLLGLEPVDLACRGHRKGEFWVHCAFPGELKCLSGDGVIYDHKQNKRRVIKEIYKSQDLPIVTSLYKEGEKHELVYAPVSHIMENGMKEVYELELVSGRKVKATPNHRFFKPGSWVRLDQLTTGDFIAIPRQTNSNSINNSYSDNIIEIIGYLIGDGTVLEKIELTNSDRTLRKIFSDCLKIEGFADDVDNDDNVEKKLRAILNDLGIHDCVGGMNSIPDKLFGLSNHQIKILIRALWSLANVNNGMANVDYGEYYSLNEKICIDIQSLLLRLGIQSSVTQNNIGYIDRPYFVSVVKITGKKSKNLFYDLMNFEGKRKITSEEEIENYDNDPYESITGDLMWDKVKSVTLKGLEMTYDMEVPEHHSFVVNDIITHNTTVALNYAYNNVVVYKKNILYVILEMPYSQLRRQLYAIHSSHGKFVTEWYNQDQYTGLDYRELRDGELNKRDFERLKIIAKDFKECTDGKLYIWRPSEEVTIDDIRRKAEAFHHKYGCDGIVIDHLGLVKSKARTSDHVVALNTVVRDTRLMALNFARGSSVPIFSLFQLNRQGKMRADKNNGIYDMAAISYANEIEKSADKITYTYLNDELRKNAKFFLGCLKNRDDAIFEPMTGKIIWKTKRMRHIETSLVNMNNDELLEAEKRITSLSMDDIMGGTGTFG